MNLSENKIIVLSGHSSSGKDMLLNKLCKSIGYDMFVSVTTRPIRLGEKDGVNYHYTTKEKFLEMIDNNELIEYRTYNTLVGGVPETWYYGARKCDVDLSKNGICIILDPVGLREFKEVYGKSVVSFFVESPEPLRKERAKCRGGFDETEWNRRYKDDQKIFDNEFLEKDIDFVVLNDANKNPNDLLFDIIHCLSNSKEYIMVESNLKLVGYAIKKYHLSNLDEYEDLYQVGSIGLFNAVKTFNKAHGVAFSTYATKCIKNQILTVYLTKKYENSVLKSSLSLDAEDYNNLTLHDKVKSDQFDAEDILQKEYQKQFMDTFISRIKDKYVVSLITDHFIYDMSYADMAIKYGKSRQSINQKVNRALVKYRPIAKDILGN